MTAINRLFFATAPPSYNCRYKAGFTEWIDINSGKMYYLTVDSAWIVYYNISWLTPDSPLRTITFIMGATWSS